MKYGLAVCVWFFVIVFIISCKQQKHRETFKDGSYNEGYAINDSLFNGIVKLYDSNGKYTGFLTYKSGIKNGLCVRYRLDGTTSDSFFYRNGEQFGNAYKFNKKGEMSNINFLSTLPGTGPRYTIKDGKFVYYEFISLEGDVLYVCENKNSTIYENGEYINLKCQTISCNSNDYCKLHLFIYFIRPYFMDVKYYLAILDSKNSVLSKELIKGNGLFYYSEDLDTLPIGKYYALILDSYDSNTNKPSTMIAKLNNGCKYGLKRIDSVVNFYTDTLKQ